MIHCMLPIERVLCKLIAFHHLSMQTTSRNAQKNLLTLFTYHGSSYREWISVFHTFARRWHKHGMHEISIIGSVNYLFPCYTSYQISELPNVLTSVDLLIYKFVLPFLHFHQTILMWLSLYLSTYCYNVHTKEKCL